MRVTRVLAVTALAGGMLLTGAGAASADPPTPGTPGEANCVGQSLRFGAQFGKNFDLDGVRGVGGLSREFGLEGGEANQFIRDVCNGTIPI